MTPSRLPQILVTLLGLAAFGAVVLFVGRPSAPPPAGSADSSTTVAEPAASSAPAATVAAPAGSEPAASRETSQPSPSAPMTAPVAPQVPVPSFDVVRVEPDGAFVIAGRAAPGAEVELLRDGTVHARVKVDGSGQFVITDPILPVGPQELSLRIGGAEAQARSRQSVTVVIAEGGKEPPLVALAVPGQPTVTLSQPASVAQASLVATGQASPARGVAGSPGGDVQVLPPSLPEAVARFGDGGASSLREDAATPGPQPTTAITTVEADESGKLFASGTAAPGASVRLYLNDTFLAEAKADAAGRVAFVVEKGVTPGDYRVRLDTADTNGNVASRAEVPFNLPLRAAAAPVTDAAAPVTTQVRGAGQMPAQSPSPAAGAVAVSPPAIPVVVPEIRTATVARGDSLWRISRRLYGQGVRYTVIYEANQQQIRDPDLIYPGQVFVTPATR